MTILSRTSFTPPPYEQMSHAVMAGTTQGMYEASVAHFHAITDVVTSAITYESDGLKVTGIETLPADLVAGEKIPFMIYNRGGSGDYGMLSAGQVSVLMVPFIRRMRLGVLASNYRGNGGSEGREEWGGGDVNDVLNLLDIGKQQPWWDGKNIFMLGWSRGGMMTYLALKHGAVVNAAAVGAGVADVAAGGIERPEMVEHVYKRYIAHYDTEPERVMRERSAVCWPEQLNTPLLIMHGDDDDRVHVDEARDLAGKLQALGKPVKYVEYAGGNHALKKHWKEWTSETVAWFSAHRVAA